MISVQDKHRFNGEVVFSYLRNRYTNWLNFEPGWFLDPMPALSPENARARLEFSRRMTGIHGDGDPVWGAAIMHMVEQASGAPFSIEGPESAVDKALSFMMSIPQGDEMVRGDYRARMKELVINYVTSDIGAPVEIVYDNPRPIRPGVTTKPKPAGWDTVDPGRLRLVAPQGYAYPYAYQTMLPVPDAALLGRSPQMNRIFRSNEIPMHRNTIRRLVNMPQPEEDLFGCGVSPSAIAYPEWCIAMGELALLLQDATNTAAYTILVTSKITREQVANAMADREKALRSGDTNPIASALMLFGNEDILGDSGNGPMIAGVPLRRYPEQWNWRMWLEERIQIYSTILGISPSSIIMSIYARANQAGAQYAADEAGVRQASMMVALGDIWSWALTPFGVTFQYRSHRLADRAREFAAQQIAFDSWKALYEANINGVPLLGLTPEIAAHRTRVMMVEQKLIKPDYAAGEQSVAWDGETNEVGTSQPDAPDAVQAKALAYLGAALRGEDYVELNIDPGEHGMKFTKTRIGRCVLREPGRPVMWRGWSAEKERRWAPLRHKVADLRKGVAAFREMQAQASVQEAKEGEGRAPRGAPRKMKQVQDAWDGELETLLGDLTTALGHLDRTPSQREIGRLQSLLDHWADTIDSLEAQMPEGADIYPEKLDRAKALIEQAQEELDRGGDGGKILALLAILAFTDGVQRRGADAMRQAVTVGGLSEAEARRLLDKALRRHGAYVNGSLTPDLVQEWLDKGTLSSRLRRRSMVFYGGAVWALMQAGVLAAAEAGQRVTIEGPLDESTCLTSDPGGGIACEEIVGQTYRVGLERVPVLGAETKCGQACRHWYAFA